MRWIRFILAKFVFTVGFLPDDGKDEAYWYRPTNILSTGCLIPLATVLSLAE